MPIYARPSIHAIAGYTPGEQPVGLSKLVKLNTNENPYPPSPAVQRALADFDWQAMRLYPEPTAKPVREVASQVFGIPASRILCGNGSDDLLTIALRTFVDAGQPFAFTAPSYSLYPVLADLQGAVQRPIELDPDFGLPADLLEQAGDARLLMLARPNAPTGTTFPKEAIRDLCGRFQGVVWIDEAYADFAHDDCLDLVAEFPNVVVSRTLSKSYALAGLRLGLAFAQEPLIDEMLKLKDSYNVDRLTQAVAVAALADQPYLRELVRRIRATRAATAQALRDLGCAVLPSQTNFLFVHPAHRPAAELFQALRREGLIVRYFDLPRVRDYIRITIGTDAQMQEFLDAFQRLDQ